MTMRLKKDKRVLGVRGACRMTRSKFTIAVSFVLAMLISSAPIGAQKKDDKQDKRAERSKKDAGLPEVIFDESVNPATADLTYGVGGKDHAPDLTGTFTFIEEDMEQSQPKFDVKDSHDNRWRVKLGEEVKSETAASHLIWAMGYYVDTDYYVDQFKVEGLPKLRRGEKLVSEGGVVRSARLELKVKDVKKLGTWSWSDNPFVGTKEFNGLRVMMALVNNWDSTTINNSIYEVGGQRHYAVTDLGASFGKTGNSIERSKSNMKDYVDSKFIEKTSPEYVDFVLHSRPFLPTVVDVPNYIHRVKVTDVATHIPRADAKWIGLRLAMLSDRQIRDCFTSSGYSPEQVEGYTKAIEKRIADLNAL
jgi:hypothetical protein